MHNFQSKLGGNKPRGQTRRAYTLEEVLAKFRETNPKKYEETFPNSLTPGISTAQLKTLVRAVAEIDKTAAMLEIVISKPPGTFLSNIADFLCRKETCTSIVEPHIADMQHEYFEALAKGRKNKAKWIQIRETIRFLYVLGVHRVLKAVASLFSHAKMPQ